MLAKTRGTIDNKRAAEGTQLLQTNCIRFHKRYTDPAMAQSVGHMLFIIFSTITNNVLG